jgi:outer membrane protein
VFLCIKRRRISSKNNSRATAFQSAIGSSTVSNTGRLQYHFPTNGPFDPYAGLGVNYTIFFDQETTGALAGMDLDLDNSPGLAAQLGFDYELSDSMFLNFDLRMIDIETDADLNGAPLETVDIDPLVYSISVGWRF